MMMVATCINQFARVSAYRKYRWESLDRAQIGCPILSTLWGGAFTQYIYLFVPVQLALINRLQLPPVLLFLVHLGCEGPPLLVHCVPSVHRQVTLDPPHELGHPMLGVEAFCSSRGIVNSLLLDECGLALGPGFL